MSFFNYQIQTASPVSFVIELDRIGNNTPVFTIFFPEFVTFCIINGLMTGYLQ